MNKRELEPLGRPLRALVGELLEPDAQVLRHRRDFVLPDAIDRGAEAIVFTIMDLADRGGRGVVCAAHVRGALAAVDAVSDRPGAG